MLPRPGASLAALPYVLGASGLLYAPISTSALPRQVAAAMVSSFPHVLTLDGLRRGLAAARAAKAQALAARAAAAGGADDAAAQQPQG